MFFFSFDGRGSFCALNKCSRVGTLLEAVNQEQEARYRSVTISGGVMHARYILNSIAKYVPLKLKLAKSNAPVSFICTFCNRV